MTLYYKAPKLNDANLTQEIVDTGEYLIKDIDSKKRILKDVFYIVEGILTFFFLRIILSKFLQSLTFIKLTL